MGEAAPPGLWHTGFLTAAHSRLDAALAKMTSLIRAEQRQQLDQQTALGMPQLRQFARPHQVTCP
jgi:hypothetical protein